MSDFKNKTVLVTGGTSGIGEDTALRFAQAGAQVAISGRREKEGREVVKRIEESGGQGLFIQADVAEESQVKETISTTVGHFGDLHIVFANAGVWGDPKSVVDEQKSNIDSVIDINVKGILYTLKHAVPQLIASGGGSIVTNASILGQRPMAGYSVYNASKFAVIGITRTVALELAEKNIRVNCVSPGPIETEMIHIASGGNPSAFGDQMPMKRIGAPGEISNTVLFLCSEGASYITGQVISVDGGYCAA